MYLSSQRFFKTPYKTLTFQKKLIEKKKEKSESKRRSEVRMLEMHFPAIWGPKLQKLSLW